MTNDEMREIETALDACLDGGRDFKYGASVRSDGEPFATVEEVAEHLAETARLSGERRPGAHALNLWTVHSDGEGDEVGKSIIIAHTGNGPTSEAHARFFAIAPWAIATLLGEVKRLRGGGP